MKTDHRLSGWILVALVAAGAAIAVGAEPVEYRLEPIGAIRGLPTESVTALHRDRAGFLWVGTREGLVLYDGYTYRLFDHDAADPTTISDNTVRTIFEDRDGNLWLGTNTAGLNRLDRGTWTFTHFRHDSADPSTISHDSVNAILQDRSGDLWVATQIGLNRFDQETGTFERFLADPDDPASLSSDYAYALHEDREGTLWIATVGGGLNRRDPNNGRFSYYGHKEDDPRTLSSDSVFAIAEDEDGDLWIGTSEGLDRLDRATGTIRRVGAEAHLRDTIVTSVVRGRPGVLWLGTWGGGLHEVDSLTGEARAPRYAGWTETDEDDRIVALATDPDGTVWFGSWDRGLLRLRPGLGPFEVVGAGEDGGLTHRDATSVFEGETGTLWVGTWGQGLNRRDPGEPGFRRTGDESGGKQTGVGILSLYQDPQGVVWEGLMGALHRFDPASGKVEEFANDPDDPGSLGPGYVQAILEDRSGTLWVGTGEGGLNRKREDGPGFDRFVHDPDDPGSLSDDYVTTLYEDREGTLWVGTRSGGLDALRSGSRRFLRFLPDPDDEHTLGHHYVTSITEDEDGRLWVGTAGGGLSRVDRSGADGAVSFTRFTERDGLMDDNVMGLAADRDGSLWISTKAGLSRFDPGTETFAQYGTRDGLPTPNFNVGAVANGRVRIFFGSTHGLVAVPYETPFPSRDPSPTVLRSIQTLAGLVPTDRPAWELGELEMPYGEILSFEFAVLDFGDRTRHRYAYRLEGVHDEWIDLGPRREITFTDLDPGEYTLHLRGQNDQGVWSEAGTALGLRVVPPFWMTWWFRGGVILAAVGMFVTFYRIRMATQRRRYEELQRLKDQRERALEQARRSQEALHDAYERLRKLTRRLENAKEDERKRIARELHDEMGQALTTAKINLQLLYEGEDPEERARRITDTVDLVDRMIGHVRALSLDLRPPLLDELGLVPALKGYLEIQSHRSGIDIDVETDTIPPGMEPELEIAGFRVVQEALTNVVRHAHADHVEVRVKHSDGWIDLVVRDDGKGFDVDSTLERAAGGHHLGLLGIQERVESMGGSVDIRSSPGAGTEIRVKVPLRD